MNPLLNQQQNNFSNNNVNNQIDKNAFIRNIQNISDQQIQMLIQQAQKMGMSNEQISQGLDFVHSLKNNR